MTRPIALVLLLGAWVHVPALDLVRDGRPVAALVLPAKPNAVEKLAAEELRDHVCLISGAELKIQSAPATGPRVLIGRAAASVGVKADALEPEHYRIRTGPDWLAIAGRDAALR